MVRTRITYEEAVKLIGSKKRLAKFVKEVDGLGAIDVSGGKLRVMRDEGRRAYFFEKP